MGNGNCLFRFRFGKVKTVSALVPLSCLGPTQPRKKNGRVQTDQRAKWLTLAGSPNFKWADRIVNIELRVP